MVVTPKHVLVTGANGFVGRALCPVLEADGIRLRRGTRAMYGDIGPATDWLSSATGIDAVVHLAGMAHVPHREESPNYQPYRQVNSLGTRRLAEAAAKAGARRFVFVSSASVMGTRNRGEPWTESDFPMPENAYARSKLEAEAALIETSARFGMEWVILRPPLIYGPGVKANFLKMLRVADLGAPLPLKNIHNRRRLLSLGNLVQAIHLALISEGASNRKFLVGDDEEVSTAELFTHLTRLMGKPNLLWPMPASSIHLLGKLGGLKPTLDRLIGDFRFDDGEFRTACGWQPAQTMGEGLRGTVEWYQKRRKTARE